MNCRLQAPVHAIIVWGVSSAGSPEKQDYAEYRQIRKRKKNCWLPNDGWNDFEYRQAEQEKEKEKEERRTPLKQKPRSALPKGRIVAAFCFRFRQCFQPWAILFYCSLRNDWNRVAIIGRWCSKGLGCFPTSKFAKIAPKEIEKWVNLYRFTLLANLWDFGYEFISRIGYT